MSTDNDPVRRAFAAWFRTGNTTQPANYSGEYEVSGRRYVELRNINGTLAVYRIENSGRLRRLRRWPDPDKHRWEIETPPEDHHQRNRESLSATIAETIKAFSTTEAAR